MDGWEKKTQRKYASQKQPQAGFFMATTCKIIQLVSKKELYFSILVIDPLLHRCIDCVGFGIIDWIPFDRKNLNIRTYLRGSV